jgi:SRSO17 transposase
VSPSTKDEAGKAKPARRKQIPAAEQVASILRRRAASKVPEEERYRPKWRMALEMLDELSRWGHRPPLLVADAGYGHVGEFRQGLSKRDIRYVLATTSATTAHPAEAVPAAPPYAGVGRPPCLVTARRPAVSRTWPWLPVLPPRSRQELILGLPNR